MHQSSKATIGPGASRYIAPTKTTEMIKPSPMLMQLRAHGVMRSETATVFFATMRSKAESPARWAGVYVT